ncbi:MAG: hypothetical protein ACOXZ1_02525 [Patescibacteria group bacterium]|jgi:hypothetical protein
MNIEEILPGIIFQMSQEEVKILSDIIRKLHLRRGHSRIREAWEKRCRQLEISSGDIPEVLERKRLEEIRQRRISQQRNNIFFDMDY